MEWVYRRAAGFDGYLCLDGSGCRLSRPADAEGGDGDPDSVKGEYITSMIRILTVTFLFFLILQSCRRSSVKPDAPEPLPDSVLNAYYSGSWQAQVDGVSYIGTIDTSYTIYDSSLISGHPDTLLSCTGTSSDKRANIHFQFLINAAKISRPEKLSTAEPPAAIRRITRLRDNARRNCT